MKTIPINIEKKGKSKPISNVYSFTHSTIQNNSEINYNPKDYNKEIEKIISKKKYQKYTLNLDWLQFIAKKKKDINFVEHQSNELIINESNGKNPNFYKCYTIILSGTDVCELHTCPTNKSYASNEVSIKVKNNLLYHKNFTAVLQNIMTDLNLEFVRYSRIDIALDGSDNLKIMEYIGRHTKYDTIQINNENLKIDAKSFIKHNHTFSSYIIGRKGYGKTATVYNKTEEIKTSGKNYIKKYWELNGLNTYQDIGRFELQLKSRHLKKYTFEDLNNLGDAKFIGSIFKNELDGWFKLFKVKKRDIMKHRKDIAIKKGKEITLFRWKHIPNKSVALEINEIQPNQEHQAKRAISFNLDYLISNFPNNCNTSGNTVSHIQSVSADFDLEIFTARKLNEKLGKFTNLDHNQKSFICAELNKPQHPQPLQRE